MIEKVDAKKFDEIIGSEKPVVCDFYADWCGPCKMLAPVMDKLCEDYGDSAVFIKVNVDECPDLARRYGIMSIPYVGFFRGGKLTDKSIGYIDGDEAEDFIKSNI